ncbi:MAG: methionine--tRNA ligase [Nitrospiraceae bacterium]|nr:methionine--tRNA ligase [Nitrospiraceae bacterium]
MKPNELPSFLGPARLRSRLVLTTALPYANGHLHLGHAVEAIQADAFARHRRLSGQQVLFLGAEDCHGTAIELAASAAGLRPEDALAKVAAGHRHDYDALAISFDAYHSTHSAENEAVCAEVYTALRDNGHLVRRTTRQLYDTEAGRFLDDRRVRGTCPACGRRDQYGDACECGATYSAEALGEPVSMLSGTRPELREAEHVFLVLDQLAGAISQWARRDGLQRAFAAKIGEWESAGLRDWCLTRCKPYFGFTVPDTPNLAFYVWFDAPLGYIATLEHALRLQSPDGPGWREIWESPDTEIGHLIGKDIVQFHGVFWIGMLHGAGLRLPDWVHAHGFVTVGSAKMSKSRGNALTVSQLLSGLDADAFRFAVAEALGPGIDDIDITHDRIAAVVNADVVGKIANLALRARPFMATFDNRLADRMPEPALLERTYAVVDDVLACYEAKDLAGAVRGIRQIAITANGRFTAAAPWASPDDGLVHAACTDALVHFWLLAALLQPIMPGFCRRALQAFGAAEVPWQKLAKMPFGQTVKIPQTLFARIDRAHPTLPV